MGTRHRGLIVLHVGEKILEISLYLENGARVTMEH